MTSETRYASSYKRDTENSFLASTDRATVLGTGRGRKNDQSWDGRDWREKVFLRKMTISIRSTMFEHCPDPSTWRHVLTTMNWGQLYSLVDRDVTTAMRSILELPHRAKCCNSYTRTNSHGENCPLPQCSAFTETPFRARSSPAKINININILLHKT